MTDKMTREEAIKFLTLMRKAVSNFEEYGHDKASLVIECDKAEAIDIAVEALSAEAADVYKAHEEEHLNIVNRIKELQYAIAKTQTIVGKMVESAEAEPNCKTCAIKELWVATEQEDLVQVVRCKDCRHANKSMFCSVYLQPRLSSDFCNYGERREK